MSGLVRSLLGGTALLLTSLPALAGYNYTRAISIDHTKVAATQANFPVLISGTYPYLATVANGGNVQNGNGYDVVFGSNAWCSTLLNWEVESYAAATGQLTAWVNVPSLSSSTNTTIYMCYGNSSIGSSQTTAGAVWDSNFKAVYHLSDNAASTTVVDSTANAYSLANTANTSGKSSTGEIANSLNYNGSSDLSFRSNTTINFPVTFGGWFRRTLNQDYQSIVSHDAGGNSGYRLSTDSGSNGYAVSFCLGSVQCYSLGLSPALNTWYFLECSVSGNNGAMNCYWAPAGGALTTVTATIATESGTPSNIRLAQEGRGFPFGGQLDEVRWSNVVRSSGWIATEFNNENNPSAFYAIGSPLSLPAGSQGFVF